MEIKVAFFPTTRKMWLVSLFFIIVIFLLYYSFLYPHLAKIPIRSVTIPRNNDPLIYKVEMPRFVSDYVDQEMVITVSNPKEETIPCPRITVRTDRTEPFMELVITLKGTAQEQNFVEFGEIPPFSTRRAVFLMKAVSGKENVPFKLKFYFGDEAEPAQLSREPQGPVFSRLHTFTGHILVQTLLIPPLSNLALPLITLMICWFYEPYSKNRPILWTFLIVLGLHMVAALILTLFIVKIPALFKFTLLLF